MNLKLLFIVISFSFFFSIQSNAAIIYVDSSHVGGTQNGASWATAFSNFQSGINAANVGDSVWVAKGTYKPNLNSSFNMRPVVSMFGGFAGTETSISQRNLSAHQTILSGNGNRVFYTTAYLYDTLTLDGFTISSGTTTGNGGGDLYGDLRPDKYF